MLMSAKYIACMVIGFAAILGWNIFLIQRDSAMFEANRVRVCEQLNVWHPDCKR
jgi:hypothetical protein